MSHSIEEGHYYAAILYREFGPDETPEFKQRGNFFALLYRKGENRHEWTCDCRFRYYVDDQIHESKDERSHYSMRITSKDDEEVLVFQTVVALAAVLPSIEVFWVRGGPGKLLETMKGLPMFHLTEITE